MHNPTCFWSTVPQAYQSFLCPLTFFDMRPPTPDPCQQLEKDAAAVPKRVPDGRLAGSRHGLTGSRSAGGAKTNSFRRLGNASTAQPQTQTDCEREQ